MLPFCRRQVLQTAGREIFYDKRYDRGQSSPLDSEICPAFAGGKSAAAGIQCGGRRHRGAFSWNQRAGRSRRFQQCAVLNSGILHRNLHWFLRTRGPAFWRGRLQYHAAVCVQQFYYHGGDGRGADHPLRGILHADRGTSCNAG